MRGPVMNRFLIILSLIVMLFIGSCKERKPIPELEAFVVKNVIHPSNNPYNKDKVELGKMLYFDKRLSLKQDYNCATYRNFEFQTSGAPRNKIHNNIGRTLTNVALYKDVFKDPETRDLENVVKERVYFDLMSKNEKTIIQRLSAVPEYKEMFHKAFGSPEITVDRIVFALSAFQRTILSRNSNFDRFAMGEEAALTPAQKRGWDVFQNKAKCVQCHQGPNFSDSEMHTTGLPGVKDKVRTPSLRDVTRRKTFMHNGQFGSIEETVNHFADGGHANALFDPLLKPARLSEEDKRDLIEFLRSLEGETIPLEIPNIPKA
ncbi:di-heme cytochrome C peroxidase [Leptospira fainei serovar Hurstbridge str. BUT 6]|uniref:Methylamine utilization protein MauG n=2 Tax=Leptospira fainei TaxID=48782 RepID=S3US66_9LEPT|nr:di-heme cytochrome C peroxidase [Leptospira fainei serovar Hurstbridge str. BUT 6]